VMRVLGGGAEGRGGIDAVDLEGEFLVHDGGRWCYWSMLGGGADVGVAG
jgi:hypothetical protein